MSNIYDQFDAAFKGVQGYVILNGANEKIALVAFKQSPHGMGRVYCYLHVIGVPMVRGYASGYGYDKHTAAAAAAAPKVEKRAPGWRPDHTETVEAIQAALAKDGGNRWDRELENRGFKVLQAI